MPSRALSRKVLYAALGGDLVIASIKFAAAGFTGGSAPSSRTD